MSDDLKYKSVNTCILTTKQHVWKALHNYTLNIFRCAKRISKDRASSPKEVDHFVKLTPARSPQIIYNSDTVYSTTTFRPVSPSPITPPAPNTPSPQRTRKLETPLHFDGGLFSDIRSTEGKLLSRVTIDRVQSSTQHDFTDSPSAVCMQEGKNHVDAIMKTETITNKDVFTVKFTPVPPELDSPWLLTPSQFIQLQSHSPDEYFKGNQEIPRDKTETTDADSSKFICVPSEVDSPRLLTPSQFIKLQSQSPVEYIKDNYEDLQSYKIVNSLCKEKLLDASILSQSEDKTEKTVKFDIANGHDVNVVQKRYQDDLINKKQRLNVTEPCIRGQSPLENIFVSEQLQKLDNYLQESLDVCLGRKGTPIGLVNELKDDTKTFVSNQSEEQSSYLKNSMHVDIKSDTKIEENSSYQEEPISETHERVQTKLKQNDVTYEVKFNSKMVSKQNSVPKRKDGIINAIYDMPMHYHAAIICAILIIYNFIYQYIKQK